MTAGRGCSAPVRSPIDQSTPSKISPQRTFQAAPIILAPRIALPSSGVAIRPSQVSRARSVVTPSAATPAAIRSVKNSTHDVMWRRNWLNAVR